MPFEFAYLILSHANVGQLYRLVSAVRKSSPASAIVLHHDPSGEPLDESKFRAMGNVYFVENPVSVQWADITQVQALLHGLEWTVNKVGFRWLSVISGQDYPLRPLAIVEQELRETGFDAFVKADPVTTSDWAMFARYYFHYWELPRFCYYYKFPAGLRARLHGTRLAINRSRSPIRIEGGVRNTPLQLGIRALSSPFSERFLCYKGSDWLTLSNKAIDYVLDFTRDNPSFLNYFRRTYVASEAYVQTILWNNPELKVANDNRRFILWDPDHPAHPTPLTHEHLAKITASGKDFGRKFDSKMDSQILDELDRILANWTLGGFDV
jgi:hypothetical protein